MNEILLFMMGVSIGIWETLILLVVLKIQDKTIIIVKTPYRLKFKKQENKDENLQHK